MESLVTELVWLVTNYQAWVVGVLLFGDPHVWYRVTRSSSSLRCARTQVPPPPLDAKTFKVFEFLMQHLFWL